VAVALFPSISFFNHSCLANSFWISGGGSQNATSVYTSRPVKAGEEVCISYIKPSLPLIQRRDLLKRKYFFTCNCPLCLQQESINTSTSVPSQLSCSNCGKSGTQLLRCARCKTARYCNQSCQAMHWKSSHKLTCKST